MQSGPAANLVGPGGATAIGVVLGWAGGGLTSPGPFPAPTASMTRARGARAASEKLEALPPLLTSAARRARAARAGGRWPSLPME